MIDPDWSEFDRRHVLPTLMVLLAVAAPSGGFQVSVLAGLLLRPVLYWFYVWVSTESITGPRGKAPGRTS